MRKKPTMKHIQVEELDLIGRDERGSTFAIRNDRSGNYILCYRKAGTSSGRHYHSGKKPYKDPEILYLLSGTAEFRWYGLEEGPAAMQSRRLTAPVRVIIPIHVWHELRAVTDCSFWEMNSLEDVQQDSVRVEWKEEEK